MQTKSYSTRSDAVRSFKKIHGLDVSPADHIFKLEGRFHFPLDITPVEADVVLSDMIPADLISSVPEKHLNAIVMNLHGSDSFPGRERNIGLWAELDCGRAVAIATHRKTGIQKVITVRLK